MKKYVCFILLVISLFLTSCASYKDLLEDEEIVINESNPTQSIVFLTNENGYSVSTRFIVKTKVEDKIYLKEAKMYKEGFTYLQFSDSHNVNLLNNINDIVFYENESGLQGLTFQEDNVTSDISYSYKTDGFGQIIPYIGHKEFINVLDSKQLVEGVNNNNLYYAGTLEETVKHNVENYTDVFQKNIFIYEDNNEIYIDRQVTKKHIEKKDNDNPTFTSEHFNKKILNKVDIKKVQIIDYEEESYTVVLTENDIIYIINNITLKTISVSNYNNILAFGVADKHIYFVTNNTLYVVDKAFNEYNTIVFDAPIIGISWFKIREISTIKVATLNGKNSVEMFEIELPRPEPQEVLIG